MTCYTHEPSEEKRDLPSQFYGFTERGVEILHDSKYLRGLPVARALYENTRKTEKVERHESPPRPELPTAVAEAPNLTNPTSMPSATVRISDLAALVGLCEQQSSAVKYLGVKSRGTRPALPVDRKPNPNRVTLEGDSIQFVDQ